MTGRGLRAWWLPGLIALVLFGLGLLIGLDLVHCLLLSAACLALGVLPPLGAAGIRSPWPALPYGRRDGARRDVSTLTWTLMSREGRLSSRGRQRVHTVLHDALRLRGIDPGTATGAARAEALLGDEVAGWLADPDSRPLDPAQLSLALTALDRTSPDGPGAPVSTPDPAHSGPGPARSGPGLSAPVPGAANPHPTASDPETKGLP